MFNCKLRFNGEDFVEINESNHGHRQTQLGNYKGKAFVTGCLDWGGTGGCGSKLKYLIWGQWHGPKLIPIFHTRGKWRLQFSKF